MGLLPGSRRGTWLLAAAVWAGLCVATWCALPRQVSRRAVIHGASLRDAVFAPDSRWLATHGFVLDPNPAPLRFWDTTTGRPLAALREENLRCDSVHISPDGEWLL